MGCFSVRCFPLWRFYFELYVSFFFFFFLDLFSLFLLLFIFRFAYFTHSLSLLDLLRSQVNLFFLLLPLFFLSIKGKNTTIAFDGVSSVLQVEPDWKLEVQLTRSALMFSSEDIVKLNINFWTVEGSIFLVNLIRFSKFLQGKFQLRFS